MFLFFFDIKYHLIIFVTVKFLFNFYMYNKNFPYKFKIIKLINLYIKNSILIEIIN